MSRPAPMPRRARAKRLAPASRRPAAAALAALALLAALASCGRSARPRAPEGASPQVEPWHDLAEDVGYVDPLQDILEE